MAKLLRSSDEGFAAALAEVIAAEESVDVQVRETIAQTIADIREKGDEALFEYTEKFDRVLLMSGSVRVELSELEQAVSECPEELLSAMREAAYRIENYHYQQMPEDKLFKDKQGVMLGWKWTAMGVAGIYVPGGTAAYPSSVLMNAIPARIAGVDRIVMVTPAKSGQVNPVVLAAASIAGVEEIYKIGGAQAIAALAYGTGSIPKVDVIVGPGNQYVAEAKRQVFGDVGIDMIAGPSEILVIADKLSNPEWVAMDLLSQAEHDEKARAILVTDDEKFADTVMLAVKKALLKLERRSFAEASWEKNGLVVVTEDLYEAVDIANKIAPEHLELSVTEPDKLMKRVKNAGAIFLGRYTPEAIGDYMAGPSHVLPTGGSARFSSGLSVYDFLKRSSVIGCTKESFERLAQPTQDFAESEGLGAHAESIAIRREN